MNPNTHNNIWCSSLLLLVMQAAWGAGTGDRSGGRAGVRLVHELRPGTALTYAFRSELSQEMAQAHGCYRYGMALTGTVRQVVVEVDNADGSALLGQLGTSRLTITASPDGADGTTKNQVWLSAYRMERSGRCVPRTPKTLTLRERLLRGALNQITAGSEMSVPFPGTAVRPGDRWEGRVLLPLPGVKQYGQGASSLIGLLGGEGGRMAVIRTESQVARGLSQAGYFPHVLTPDMAVTGICTGRFDLAHGVWRQVAWHLAATLGGQGVEGKMRMKSKIELVTVRALPAADHALWRARIKAFDAAIDEVYTGEIEKALEQLDAQSREAEDLWKQGLNVTIALLSPLSEPIGAFSLDGAPQEEYGGPEAELMTAADRLAKAGGWEQAAQRYELLAQKYPNHALAILALRAAAAIRERALSQPTAALALRVRLVVLQERQAKATSGGDPSPVALYKLARVYAEAGRLRDAVTSYERFLALPDKAATPQWRVMAQYQLGRTFEKLGKPGEALAAYRAIPSIEAADSYSSALRRKAAERVAVLARRAGE